MLAVCVTGLWGFAPAEGAALVIPAVLLVQGACDKPARLLLWVGKLDCTPACRGAMPKPGDTADLMPPPLVLAGCWSRLGKAPVPLLAGFADSCGREVGLKASGLAALPLGWPLLLTNDGTPTFGTKPDMPGLGRALRCCEEEMLPVPARDAVVEADRSGFGRTFGVRAVRGELLTARPANVGTREAAGGLNGVLPDFADVESGVSAVLAGTGMECWKHGEAGNIGLAVLGCLGSTEAGPGGGVAACTSMEARLFGAPAWGPKGFDNLAVCVSAGTVFLDNGREAFAGSEALPA